MSKGTAVCPGSFDPVTLGHLDLFRRAAAVFDRVVVLVMHNEEKPGFLDAETRVRLIRESLDGTENVSVRSASGLLAEAVRSLGADAVVKGVRNQADLEYEADMARINLSLGAPETLLLPADPALRHVSTSNGLQLFRLGADVSGFFPPAVLKELVSRGEPRA
ncbi:MAG: pantetheine-phosphate adenylyltransferase [Oscillospiraceae bacterium]|jgi:pantetheine-phosphate adenylyltransferase|nr:pantetheine-phosphate adenylyltransferase [Oscillospiraceae bacterium]